MDMSSATTLGASLSQALSSATMDRPNTISSALPSGSEVLTTHGASSWLGSVGNLVLFSIHAVTTAVYWVVRLVTISIPSPLFTLFSTSLTVTMNATTL